MGLLLTGCTESPPAKLPGDAWPTAGSTGASSGQSNRSSLKAAAESQRFCELIALNPDRVEEFQKLHQKIPQGVRDAIRQKNIRNYSVFICSTKDQVYAIRYYEYVGEEYAADMAELERHPDYKTWRNAWEECQVTLMPLSSGNWWAPSKEICHLE
ncbi:MAG: L-rhamnose mutarotase [Thermoguttaceae bacterium]|nr:L-rhamnose mutarotase [Thermoguttaceae bacterium]MDW8037165.1 L-rhamnose mutarotase [Thermoguttaceae bacterium]